MIAGPVPPPPEVIESQSELLLDVIHGQLFGLVVRLKDPVPPAAAMLADDGDKEYVQLPAAWVTVNVWPATVRVPVRSTVKGFACTV